MDNKLAGKTILIVDDDLDETDLEILRDVCKATVITAETLASGKDEFNKNKDLIDLIVMDGCVETRKSQADTLPLIEYIRQTGFTKNILAASFSRDNLAPMKAAGASHTYDRSDVKALYEVICELLPAS